MATLDPKGLEAAIIAVEERGCVHFGGEIEAAIRAYLSTVTPAEVGGMVERLRYAENVAINDSHAAQTELSSTPAADNEYADNRAKLCAAVEETISLIQSQAARIAELEAVLARVPGALNGAFMAGSEEREGGSARRQERYAAEADALRVEIPALLKGERKG